MKFLIVKSAKHFLQEKYINTKFTFVVTKIFVLLFVLGRSQIRFWLIITLGFIRRSSIFKTIAYCQ